MSTWSILSAVNDVNLVNTVNAVKYPPPPGGVAAVRELASACGGREWKKSSVRLRRTHGVWTVLT
ncbi:MAG: hypothetical protein ACK480_17190 [Planctomycetota bacterium]